jgi:hypothetical protein
MGNFMQPEKIDSTTAVKVGVLDKQGNVLSVEDAYFDKENSEGKFYPNDVNEPAIAVERVDCLKDKEDGHRYEISNFAVGRRDDQRYYTFKMCIPPLK